MKKLVFAAFFTIAFLGISVFSFGQGGKEAVNKPFRPQCAECEPAGEVSEVVITANTQSSVNTSALNQSFETTNNANSNRGNGNAGTPKPNKPAPKPKPNTPEPNSQDEKPEYCPVCFGRLCIEDFTFGVDAKFVNAGTTFHIKCKD